jgi:4-hydroxy-3-methylbut-2-enyl diphosphate reductase IspH
MKPITMDKETEVAGIQKVSVEKEIKKVSMKEHIEIFGNHENGKTVGTGDMKSAEKNQPITSFQIGDCITVFYLGQKSNSAFHADEYTTTEELDQFGKDYLCNETFHTVYVIGGNSSDNSKKLLEMIQKFVGNSTELTILFNIGTTKEPYVSATIIDNSLYYFTHEIFGVE